MYNATHDLLQKSTGKPIYALMRSGTGGLAYACSELGHSRWRPIVPRRTTYSHKCGVWHIEAPNEWLNAFVLDSGWVQTNIGNAAARLWGLEQAPETPEMSIFGMVEALSMGTKEYNSGKFVRYSVGSQMMTIVS